MAEERYQTQQEVFPDMPQAPEVTFPDQPDLFGTCNCKWKKIGYIVGGILAVLLIICGIYYLFTLGWPNLSTMDIIRFAAGFLIGVLLALLCSYFFGGDRTSGNGGGSH